MKTYEALFIFSGSLKEEALEKTLERVREDISKLKGSIQDTQLMGKRTFARPLKNQESGQYVKMNFSMEPESISTLTPQFKLNEDIFRIQITRLERRQGEPVSSNKEVVSNAES